MKTTLPACHPEQSEGSRFFSWPARTRLLVAFAPRNDRFSEPTERSKNHPVVLFLILHSLSFAQVSINPQTGAESAAGPGAGKRVRPKHLEPAG